MYHPQLKSMDNGAYLTVLAGNGRNCLQHSGEDFKFSSRDASSKLLPVLIQNKYSLCATECWHNSIGRALRVESDFGYIDKMLPHRLKFN